MADGNALVGAQENPYALQREETGTSMVREVVDARIAAARSYPRDITQFLKEAIFGATYNVDVAEDMWYSRPQDGRDVEGPSVRLAEIVVSAYGNLSAGFDIIGHDGKQIKAEGYCIDLERNTEARVTVTRRITTKAGKTFGESMITTTGLAAGAIAYRNAVFKVVPGVFVKEILKAAKQKVRDAHGTNMEETVKKAFDWFLAQGVENDVVMRIIEKESTDDIDMDDVIKLRGIMTAINGGDLTARELIRDHGGKHGEDDAPSLNELLDQQAAEESES